MNQRTDCATRQRLATRRRTDSANRRLVASDLCGRCSGAFATDLCGKWSGAFATDLCGKWSGAFATALCGKWSGAFATDLCGKWSGAFATAPPPDVRRGCASPYAASNRLGLCPSFGLWPNTVQGTARTGGIAPVSRFIERRGGASPHIRRRSRGEKCAHQTRRPRREVCLLGGGAPARIVPIRRRSRGEKCTPQGEPRREVRSSGGGAAARSVLIGRRSGIVRRRLGLGRRRS